MRSKPGGKASYFSILPQARRKGPDNAIPGYNAANLPEDGGFEDQLHL